MGQSGAAKKTGMPFVLDHDPNILMFDVPPPFLSRGLDQYMATWEKFFSSCDREARL